MGFFDRFRKKPKTSTIDQTEIKLITEKHSKSLKNTWKKQAEYAQNMQDASEARTKCKIANDQEGAKKQEVLVEKFKSLLHNEQLKENSLKE